MPKPFPKEFWRDVIAVARQGNQSIAQVARSFGVSESCGVRTLKCSVSRHLSRAAQTIEEWVTELVVARLSRSDAAELLVDTDRPDAAKLRAEAMAKRARLGQLTELVADGTLSADAVRTASARLKAELAGIEGPDGRRWPGGRSRSPS